MVLEKGGFLIRECPGGGFKSAFPLIKQRTDSKWPFCAAVNSGVVPSSDAPRFKSAAASIKH
jgi:hypothetical protein